MPKLENKTQTGTIVYIVLLIINCSTYMYNIIIYSVQQNKAHAAEYCAPTELVRCSRLAWYRTRIGRVQYSQYQCIYVCILFWKIMLNRSLIVILWKICGLLKQIINHKKTKFVLSKLVLTGVCCKHFMYTCMHRSCRLLCTWSVCLPTLWSDFYLTYKISTILF